MRRRLGFLMLAPLRSARAALPRDRDVPLHVQAILAGPLFVRFGSLFIGLLGPFGLGLVAILRIDGPWPAMLLAVNLATSVPRVLALQRGNKAALPGQPPNTLRYRQRFQICSLAWAASSAALACYCMATNEDLARLVAVTVTAGICGGIASRNAGSPRYAVAMVTIWLLPLAVVYVWLGPAYWIISALAVLYLAALISIVRWQYGDMRALIDAEQRSAAAQAALAVRESELQAIFRNAAAGMIEVDLAAGRVVRVNPVYCRMVARTEAELLGRLHKPQSLYPADFAAVAHWLNKLTEIGATRLHEHRFERSDGSIVWAQVSSWVTGIGADGCATRAVAITQDCTEQKVTQAALAASEEMLQLSMNVGRIGSYQRDFRTQMIHCGPATRIMHGLPMHNAPVPFIIWGAMILLEDRPPLEHAFAAAHAARQEINDFHYRFVHPVHGVRHIEARDRTEYDTDGSPVQSVGVIIDVTERRLAEARIAHLAHHDPLTALPNRTLFRTRLDQALDRAGSGEPFALLSLDLDRFKEVNDTLGHLAGDALLRAVTERLNSLIRPTDTVARVGGDEFAVIQAGPQRPADPIVLAERIVTALGAPFDLDGLHVVIGTSVGIAVAPEDGLDAQTLLSRADVALYAAKGDGRGCYRRFEPHMDTDLQARRTLEHDLRQALEHNEFELFYQPIINVARRDVCGFEALLRWHHPVRGLVPPDCFIPLAEATRLVVPIGAWALRQACAEAASWTDGTRVAVNLSAVQLPGGTLVETVTDALRRSGLDPHRLELEITETALLQDTEATLATLHQLKALGVTIAMDDFGTGYSSLGYLQRVPFDKVKIDRSFTSQLVHTRESAAIVRAVIGLCSSLDMRTTAEGVETLEQFEALAKVGCTEAQGYYFSRPQPAAAIPAMVARIGELFRQRAETASAALISAGLKDGRSAVAVRLQPVGDC